MGYEFRFDLVVEWIPFFIGGAQWTVILSAASMITGIIIGLAVAIVRVSRVPVLSALAVGYTEFFRGTPQYTQLLWIAVSIPLLTRLSIAPFVSAWAALSLNMGAFLGEIFRAGIKSLPKGQWEAAMALGMTTGQAYRRIILPQAVLRVIPPTASMWVTLFRSTEVAAMIGFSEMLFRARIASYRTYRPLEMFTAIAIMYLVLVLPQARFADYLHRKFEVRE